MSDSLDTFTLKYKIDLSNSLERLAILKNSTDKIEKAGSNSGKAFGKFAEGATNEIGKLVPGVNALSAAAQTLGAEFGVAGAAVGVLAAGIKSVIDLRNSFNEQRLSGMDLGVSATRVENYQRAFVRNSGGMVGREAALDGITKLSNMSRGAYSDLSGVGRLKMKRFLGIDVGGIGNPTGINEQLGQLAQFLHGKSKGEVQGIAKANDLSQDWLLTVQKLGDKIGNITELTQKEVEERQKAEQAVMRYNDDLAQLNEKYKEASIVIGEALLPMFEKLSHVLGEIAGKVPNAVKDLEKTGFTGSVGNTSSVAAAHPQKKGGLIGWWRRLNGIPDEDYQSAQNAANNDPKRYQDQGSKNASTPADKIVDGLDDNNKKAAITAANTALAMNMFATSVQSFNTGVTNLKQAWASWAGEIGKAAGVKGASGTGPVTLSGGGKGDWKSSPHADLIAASAKANGIDPQLMYAVMMTESGGVNGKTSSTGAGGLMQVTRGNWSKLGGGADVMDPAANIMVGGKILAEQLRIHKGDMDAGLRGYNGNSDPNYVDKVGKFYGGNAKGIGQSRETGMQIPAVQKAVADYLGVPLAQIQNGGVNRGDAAFALQQIKAGTNNNLFKLNNELKNPMLNMQPGAKAALMRQIREQTAGAGMLDKFGQGVVDKQLNNDTRSMTQGQMPIINITVNGAGQPKEVASEVQNQLNKAMADLMANYASAEKG